MSVNPQTGGVDYVCIKVIAGAGEMAQRLTALAVSAQESRSSFQHAGEATQKCPHLQIQDRMSSSSLQGRVHSKTDTHPSRASSFPSAWHKRGQFQKTEPRLRTETLSELICGQASATSLLQHGCGRVQRMLVMPTLDRPF